MFFYLWQSRLGTATFMPALNYSYVLYSQATSSTLCMLEHEGLAVQSSHSSPFMLTLTGQPCPLPDLFIGSVLSFRLLVF